MAALKAITVPVTFEIPHVESVERLSLRPGDRIVLTSASRLDDEQFAELSQHIKSWGLPEDVKVIILEAGLSLQVLSREDGD